MIGAAGILGFLFLLAWAGDAVSKGNTGLLAGTDNDNTVAVLADVRDQAVPSPDMRGGQNAMTLEDARAIIAKYPIGATSTNPQFILLAFDGSRSIRMWQQTRGFAKEMASSGHPVHFTYFINAVYLLDPEFHAWFQSPSQPAGISNIGFGTSKTDVLSRIAEINAAYAEGHEIGSHNAGHFEGGRWSKAEWLGQFDLFDKIVFDSESMRSEYQVHVPKSQVVGFRAPDLSINAHGYEALQERHFLYDASKTAKGHAFPYKDAYGLWQLSLPSIAIGPRDSRGRQAYVLAMDYNLFLRDTKGLDILKKGTAAWNTVYAQTLDAFANYFDSAYAENRAPVYFASHFSSWNDGVYWEAMRDFARLECSKPEVYCVTYKDLAMWMEAKDVLAKGAK